MRIFIIGYPSEYGGADTELWHTIKLWRRFGLDVTVVPTWHADDRQKVRLQEVGVATEVCDGPGKLGDVAGLGGSIVVSFCNGEFLQHLPEIRRYARTTSFVNCMTWNFDRELAMQERGLIDFHLYQTDHAFERVSGKLETLGTYRPLRFVPYFHTEDFPYHDNRPDDKFRFGRISRGDADKFGSRQLWIYETMTAPVLKEGLIVGWDDRARKRFGREPDSYIRTAVEGGMSQQEFYRYCEAIIMTTETFENLPRVGFEAMSSGSILVVDNRGGWQLQVDGGVTGWLCADDREFVYKASRCAFEREERDAMRQKARASLSREWGLETAMHSWGQVFQAMSGLGA